LARKLEAALLQVPDDDYRQHVIGAFYARAKEMDVPLLKLALFLDPRYRQAALSSSRGGSGDSGGASSSSNSSAAAMQTLAKLQVEAGQLAQKLGYTEEEVGGLFLQMKAYAFNQSPFNVSITNPETYWTAVVGNNSSSGSSSSTVNSPQLLASIATRLLEIKPTATTPEQVPPKRQGRIHFWVQCRLWLQLDRVPAPYMCCVQRSKCGLVVFKSQNL
jgi:hypothetical protein